MAQAPEVLTIYDYTQTSECCKVSWENGPLTADQIKQAVTDLAALPVGKRAVLLAYACYGWGNGVGNTNPDIELAQVSDPIDWFRNGPRWRFWREQTLALYSAWKAAGVRPDILILDHEAYFSPFRIGPDTMAAVFQQAKDDPNVVLPPHIRAIPASDFNRYGHPDMRQAQITFYQWSVRVDEQGLNKAVVAPFRIVFGVAPTAANYDSALLPATFVDHTGWPSSGRRLAGHDCPELYLRMANPALPSTEDYEAATRVAIETLDACPGRKKIPFCHPPGALTKDSYVHFRTEQDMMRRLLIACRDEGVDKVCLWRPYGHTEADVDAFKRIAQCVYGATA